MTAILVAADSCSLLAATGIGLACKYAFHGSLDISAYLVLWPYLFVFLLVFGIAGLYPAIALSAPDELRRAVISSLVVFLSLAAATMTSRSSAHLFTFALCIAIIFSGVLIPMVRALVRGHFSTRAWWGCSAVIFGDGPVARSVLETLQQQKDLGLKPIALVDSTATTTEFAGVPFVATSDLPKLLGAASSCAYAIIAKPGKEGGKLAAEIGKQGLCFSRLIYIADIVDSLCLWVTPRTVGGMLGLEVRQQHLLREMQLVKRILDVLLTVIIGLVTLPILGMIALAIHSDSEGPILFGHLRIGRRGVPFRAWKFRTMVVDAQRALTQYLDQNPAAREEWERDHKLRHDPRITRVGRVLRKLSLDELPQLWNVLRGEMSLVGPRPIVQAEVPKYGSGIDMYTAVFGGLTGLWQVSGRNDVSYDERVRLDCFYVQNWSVWLDLCILFRTIGALLQRRGSY